MADGRHHGTREQHRTDLVSAATSPHKAGPRQVGLCAFFEHVSGFGLYGPPAFPAPHPLAGNASR